MSLFQTRISSPSQLSLLPTSLHHSPTEVTLITSVEPLCLLVNAFKKNDTENYSGTGVSKPGMSSELRNRLCIARRLTELISHLPSSILISLISIFKLLQSPKAHGKATHSENQTRGISELLPTPSRGSAWPGTVKSSLSFNVKISQTSRLKSPNTKLRKPQQFMAQLRPQATAT